MVSIKPCPAECKEGLVGGLPVADCSLVVGLGHRGTLADACLPDWSNRLDGRLNCLLLFFEPLLLSCLQFSSFCVILTIKWSNHIPPHKHGKDTER
jgi:hypothetical protein